MDLLFSYIREFLGFAQGADQEEMAKRLEEQSRMLAEKDKEIDELRKQLALLQGEGDEDA